MSQSPAEHESQEEVGGKDVTTNATVTGSCQFSITLFCMFLSTIYYIATVEESQSPPDHGQGEEKDVPSTASGPTHQYNFSLFTHLLCAQHLLLRGGSCPSTQYVFSVATTQPLWKRVRHHLSIDQARTLVEIITMPLQVPAQV